MKEQEKLRILAKELKMKEKLKKDRETWNVLAGKGADRVREEANRWLATPMGKQYVKERARELLTTDDEDFNFMLKSMFLIFSSPSLL